MEAMKNVPKIRISSLRLGDKQARYRLINIEPKFNQSPQTPRVVTPNIEI